MWDYGPSKRVHQSKIMAHQTGIVTSLFLVGNSGRSNCVRHSSRKSGATCSYQMSVTVVSCVQTMVYGCQCLECVTCTQMLTGRTIFGRTGDSNSRRLFSLRRFAHWTIPDPVPALCNGSPAEEWPIFPVCRQKLIPNPRAVVTVHQSKTIQDWRLLSHLRNQISG